MENKDIITLEDNKEYIILDIIDKYFYLVNKKDSQDFCIRKLKNLDSPTIIELSDEKEFNKAQKMLADKMKNPNNIY